VASGQTRDLPAGRRPLSAKGTGHRTPVCFHDYFLAEYRAAVEGARQVERYRQLHDLLRLWRLRAVAYSGPGYESRLQAFRGGRDDDFTSADQVIPGWPAR
jgi:hypothetical protein